MRRTYVLVEGHGEVQAVGNLLSRLAANLKLPLVFATPMRWPNLHIREGVCKAAERIRHNRDGEALLVLRDEDDRCPRERGPETAGWLASLGLPFPAAVVLFPPEYEVLFLPCIERMAGKGLPAPDGTRPGLVESARWTGDWERKRDVKRWLTSRFPPGRSYKPTTDQLPMTQMIDLAMLRASGLRCFGTLERALAFLAEEEKPATVYPPIHKTQ